jgi:hypothetical protein
MMVYTSPVLTGHLPYFLNFISHLNSIFILILAHLCCYLNCLSMLFVFIFVFASHFEVVTKLILDSFLHLKV